MPITFDQFRDELHGLLLHLQDPSFRPTDCLFHIVGCDPSQGAGPLQTAVVAAIQAMAPGSEVPPNANAQRNFDSLHKRFVLGLTQDETAESLHMSVRHLHRVQAEATHVLARRLWQRQPSSANGDDQQGVLPQNSTGAGDQAPDWRSQTDVELAALKMSAPNAVADVGDVVRGVLELGSALGSGCGASIEVGSVQPGLMALTHPSVLRQTLITAIGQVARLVAPGRIVIYAALEDGQAKITLTGPISSDEPLDEELVRAIIASTETSIEICRREDAVFLWMRIPAVGERTVLVVEDNPDMVYFYRRSTAGTTYRIIQATPDRELIDRIEEMQPDAIVLDVMLPDIDGWQLLTHLHDRLATRSIPVVVCSVVREEALALALGATSFLSKPIRPREFVAALDQALLQESGADARAAANTVGAC
jgi:CheY-like chemotaxis protein